MSEGISLVRAKPGDHGVLTAIAHASKRHWGYPDHWIAAWKDDLSVTPEQLETGHVYSAFAGGAMIGWYGLRVSASEAELWALWVLPEWIGKKVGRALFAHAEGLARRLGATRIVLESDPHAEGFYRQMGMSCRGGIPADMDGVARVRPIMDKALVRQST